MRAAVSIPVDSLFWQRWTWPEAESILFNVVEGKSSDWGVRLFPIGCSLQV